MQKKGFILGGFLFILLAFIFLAGIFPLKRIGLNNFEPGKLLAETYIEPHNPIPAFIKNIKVQTPTTYKNLTIYPVVTGNYSTISNFLTLSEAVDAKTLLIKEMSNGEEVNKLIANNKSNKYVFIMAGEILTGGKQDRILKYDALLPPKSGDIELDAFCVEHGRWTYNNETFSSQTNANISVRQKAQIEQDQSAVWSKVDDTHKNNVGSVPETGSLNLAYENDEYRQKSSDYASVFENLLEKYNNANGVVVVINGKILVAEIFMDSKTLNKMWPKLIQSYILEALSKGEVKNTITKSEVLTFINYLITKEYSFVEIPGDGDIIQYNSSNIDAQALILKKNTIHLVEFPRYERGPKDEIPQLQRNY